MSSNSLLDALHSDGLLPIQNILRPGINRMPGVNKKPGNRAGWCWRSTDGNAAVYGDFSTGLREEWFAENIDDNPAKKVAARQEARRAMAVQAERRRQKQVSGTEHAQDKWKTALPVGAHRYAQQRKKLSGCHNARLDASTGALLIPMLFAGIGLVNLQQIFPDGSKLFLKGARVKGAYSVVGNLNNATRVIVCEGWATGATLAELYGLPVIVAFNAGNLLPVCQSLLLRFKNITVIVAGDDDRQNTVNTGRQKAIQAAEAIDATLLFPELCKCCTCTDHNDVMVCNRRRARG